MKQALSVPYGTTSDFDLNPELARHRASDPRPAGVLVAVTGSSDKAGILLTKRSSALKHHPGQIAFPGGKVDPGDADPVDAALREAEEEVSLPRELCTVLGTLEPHLTVTNFVVTPVIARVIGAFEPRPETGEVEEIFEVPFSHFMDPARFYVESRRWQGVQRSYFTAPWGPFYVWGATARILKGLSDRIAACA